MTKQVACSQKAFDYFQKFAESYLSNSFVEANKWENTADALLKANDRYAEITSCYRELDEMRARTPQTPVLQENARLTLAAIQGLEKVASSYELLAEATLVQNNADIAKWGELANKQQEEVWALFRKRN
ncbi:MAG: hypothetical protein ACH346_04765 [Chthoniobacterales bacterium]